MCSEWVYSLHGWQLWRVLEESALACEQGADAVPDMAVQMLRRHLDSAGKAYAVGARVWFGHTTCVYVPPSHCVSLSQVA